MTYARLRSLLIPILVAGCFGYACGPGANEIGEGDSGGGCKSFAHVDFICGKHIRCISETQYEEYETIPCWEVDDVDPLCCEGGECHFVGTENCPADHTCVPSSDHEADDECVLCDACIPDCLERECGSDGCGGHCGQCDDWLFCGDSGLCSPGDPPQCHGKMCGPDSMGGSCGACPEGWDCGEVGRCAPSDDAWCGDFGGIGTCVNGWKVTCLDDELQYESCPYEGCAVAPDSESIECVEAPCLPDCFGRNCGGDGCGGSCGECSSFKRCESGSCVAKGDCHGSTKVRCSGHGFVSCGGEHEQWAVTRCLDQGLICGPLGCGGVPGCRKVWPGAFPCDDLPEAGSCVGDHYFHCVDAFLAVDHCGSLGPYVCGRKGMEEVGCVLDE